MKTLGRIFIILVAFVLVMSVTYVAVNAGGTSSNGALQLENGERPQFQPGERPGGERGFGVTGLMFGFIKNTVIIAVIVVLIAVPRNWMRNRKQTAPVLAE